MNTSLSIVGSSRLNGDRQELDFYPTPPYVVSELLKREEFVGNIWECACGDGSMSRELERNGFSVISTDIVYRGYGSIDNFLTSDIVADNIITNPPYRLSLEFVLRAKQHANKKIAMFLKTVWLEGSNRYGMFQDNVFPLKTVYQFSKRVTLYKNGEPMKNGGMIAYAWFVWDRSYIGKPTLEWINIQP